MQLSIPEMTLLERVGRGPGSVVYRALHHGRSCAVKLPSERPLPEGADKRHSFERDVLALARLRRFGLPHVLQLGATEQTTYAVLAEPDGEPLAACLREGRTRAELLLLMRKLVGAVQQLHAAGFVHDNLSLQTIQVWGPQQDVMLADRGSINRPVPFDPRAELRTLALILHTCIASLPPADPAVPLLTPRLDELAHAERDDCSELLAELDALTYTKQKRSSRYPQPSVDPLESLPQEGGARSELTQLLWSKKRAAAQRGKLIQVIGSAGSGKSRLLRAFAQEVSLDCQVLTVRCRDSDWAPFSALKRLLEGHLASLSQLHPEHRRSLEQAMRHAAGPMAAAIGLLSPRLAELFREARVEMADGDVQRIFIESLADFLSKYLESAVSSVVVIDDVHWLDASSRMVLSRVAARVCGNGHMFVCGVRDDADSGEHLSRFREPLAPELIETLALGPLSREDTARVIADYLGLGEDSEPAPELVAQLAQLSDGTPLCLLELLRLMIECGDLRPHHDTWRLDIASVRQMRLPRFSRELIEQRLQRLPVDTFSVLRAAAITRGHIDEALLALVTDCTLEQVHAALASAVDARLLGRSKRGVYGFVHDSVWEGLLRELPRAEQRALHQRVVEALYREGGHGPQYEYELAQHHVDGLVGAKPQLACEATRRAAMRAFEAGDDVLAMSFFKAARVAARLSHIELDRELYVRLAESSLRLGASRQSLLYFRRALARSREDYQRAHVLARMAWIHHYESDAQECLRTLRAALAELGRVLPGDDAIGLALGALSASVRRERFAVASSPSAQRAETLCTLYIECTRVEVESGHPVRGLAAVARLALAAREAAPSRTTVHAELLVALMLSTLGMENVWRERLERAQTLARELGDPVAQTLCFQFQYMIAGWRGDIAECERQALECVVERGHFMELSELCSVCYGMYAIEQLRGRPEAAWAWLERAIERVCTLGQAAATFAIIEDAAHLTLQSLGREKHSLQLGKRLAGVRRAQLQKNGYFHHVAFQSRIQMLTESGELGAEFEATVAEFERLGVSSRQVHLVVLPYYVHVAHARVGQCLRAAPARWPQLLPKLKRALHDLEAGDRVPLISAHVRFARAAMLFFQHRRDEAEHCLADAERLAEDQRCLWVSYAAARLRAHMLRYHGNELAALDQARIAAHWAEQSGQYSRLLAIREEFELARQQRPRRPSDTDSLPMRSSLEALVHIGHANSRELRPERQAQLILGEVIAALKAERALLFMHEEPGRALGLRAARNAAGEKLGDSAAYDRELVQRVYATGQTKICKALTSQLLESPCIVAPLVLREQPVGVLYVDRAEAALDFSSEDAALLHVLANQVPLAMELASALRTREQLENNLRSAHKMEAVGRLVGGVAHDFNNVLTAIQLAAGSLAQTLASALQHSDLNDIVSSAERGAQLTRQLLAFARGGESRPKHVELGELVRKLQPALQREVSQDVELDLQVDPTPNVIFADPTELERVLSNLCRNGSDAMPTGGRLQISVRPAALTTFAAMRGELRPDRSYVELTVSDTGTGISDEVRSHLFEPFFTTKPRGYGTGLGLSNVYTIVQHCSGHIEVISEPGIGTTFRVYFPLALEPRADAPRPELVPPRRLRKDVD
jgi:signal transduction histidine kinase/ABC-type cobalamin transport system ATPase subunit